MLTHHPPSTIHHPPSTHQEQLGASGPLEIELNGNDTHSGTWVGVSVVAKCQRDYGRVPCSMNASTGEREQVRCGVWSRWDVACGAGDEVWRVEQVSMSYTKVLVRDIS
jgi:hypothetical protein